MMVAKDEQQIGVFPRIHDITFLPGDNGRSNIKKQNGLKSIGLSPNQNRRKFQAFPCNSTTYAAFKNCKIESAFDMLEGDILLEMNPMLRELRVAPPFVSIKTGY
jgi:hypothetical protein